MKRGDLTPEGKKIYDSGRRKGQKEGIKKGEQKAEEKLWFGPKLKKKK